MSKREYRLIGVERDLTLIDLKLNVHDLLATEKRNMLNDDLEVMYALQEVADDILDLQLKETMFVSLHRDSEVEKGVLMRIN